MTKLSDLDVWLLDELRGSDGGLTVGELHSRAQTLDPAPERPAISLALDRMRIQGRTKAGPFTDDRCTARVWNVTS